MPENRHCATQYRHKFNFTRSDKVRKVRVIHKLKKPQAGQSLRLFFRAFGTFRLPKMVCSEYTKVVEICCLPMVN